MMERTSIVDHITLQTLAFSSTFQIGDSSFIQGLSRALALQRQKEIFYGNEGAFESFSIFQRPIPLPPLTGMPMMTVEQRKPIIKVHSIDLVGVSSSSVLHIGNSKHIAMDARVKHIRQLNKK